MDKEKLKNLLDDPRTGLKDSSDTNKTRQAILGMFDAYTASLVEKVEERVNALKEEKILGFEQLSTEKQIEVVHQLRGRYDAFLECLAIITDNKNKEK